MNKGFTEWVNKHFCCCKRKQDENENEDKNENEKENDNSLQQIFFYNFSVLSAFLIILIN